MGFWNTVGTSQPIVMLTNSRCAVQRIAALSPIDNLILSIWKNVNDLGQSSRLVTTQRIPLIGAFQGMRDFTEGLPSTASLRTLTSGPSPFIVKSWIDILGYNWPKGSSHRATLCVHRFDQAKVSVTYTPTPAHSIDEHAAWFHKIAPPLCSACQVPEIPEHLPDVCAKFFKPPCISSEQPKRRRNSH